MDIIAPMLVGLGFFVLIGWVTYVIVDGRRRRERLKVFTEFHGKLMDRMASAAEFGDFLQSAGGQRFLATLSTERGGPKAAIMRSVHTGTIMLALGIGLLTVSRASFFDTSSEASAFVTFFAVVVVALAIGYLVSAVVSWWLGRSLGVMDEEWAPTRDSQSR
jgi:hypothetical protein